MPALPNEFTDSQTNNAVRPYSVGVKRHNETLATILVHTQDVNKKSDTQEGIHYDYLSALDRKVEALTLPSGDQSVIPYGTPVPSEGSGIYVDSLDGRNKYYGIFNNFSLLRVQEATKEIVKLHINFSADWNAFFFGERPRIYQFSGFFLDSMDYPYYQEFMVAYDKYLSGRKSIENKVDIKFVYDGKIVYGYMLDINTVTTAGDQLIKNFQFTVLVKGSHWIRTNLVATEGSTPGRVIVQEEYNGLKNVYRLNREKLTVGGEIGSA